MRPKVVSFRLPTTGQDSRAVDKLDDVFFFALSWPSRVSNFCLGQPADMLADSFPSYQVAAETDPTFPAIGISSAMNRRPTLRRLAHDARPRTPAM
jgi:hypothetical protein